MLAHITCKQGPLGDHEIVTERLREALAKFEPKDRARVRAKMRGPLDLAMGRTSGEASTYRNAITPTGEASRLVHMRGPKRDELIARYEDAKDAAVNAKATPEKIVTVGVRCISCVYVPGHCMDHRDPRHMKAAVPLFDGVPIFPMHYAWPDNWLGHIVEPEWDETPMGADGAPGINALAVIEADINDRAGSRQIARGIETKSLKRWSAGFLADFEPSHPEMNEWGWEEFFLLLGDSATGKPGIDDLYRFVVNAIPDVYEESIVDVGAIESALTLAHGATRQPAPISIASNPAPRRTLNARRGNTAPRG